MTEDQSKDDFEIKQDKYEKRKEFNQKLNDAVKANTENKQSIDDIKGSIHDMKKELCEGEDCLKKKVENKFGEIDNELKKIREDTKTYVCENCGKDIIRRFDSFCPNCAYPIPQWIDENTGQPITSWNPYWKGKEKEYGLE